MEGLPSVVEAVPVPFRSGVVAVGYHPGDDPFHGGSVLVVAG